MKYIAAALTVLSGALLWSAAVLATLWMNQAGGNRTAPELAIWGGVAIVVIGVGALAAVNQTDQSK